MKMRKLIIFLCLIVFVLAYAGCAEKQLVKSDGTASNQKESAMKQNEQPSIGGASAKQEESVKQSINKEQTAMEPAASQLTADLKDIHFDFDRYSIRPEDRKILSDNAGYLLKNKNVKIVIEGNCDERGTEEYNMALGQKKSR